MKQLLKNKRTRFWILVIAVTSVALGYYIARPRPVLVETGTVARGLFVENIRVDGIVRSKDRHVVPAFADGDIKRVSLRVGDAVKKGQVVAELFWDLKYDPVKAPISGVVSKVHRESAGPIRRGEPIMEIIDPNELEIMAELLTTDAVRVETGDPVKVDGWGGDQPIMGRVTRISKAGFTKPSALGVEEEKTEVTAELLKLSPEVAAKIGSNFHVNVEIQIAEHPDVLKVPVGAIFRTGSSWSVYRIEGGRAKLATIEIAARNNEEVMVTGGLSDGDPVINYPGDLVRDGQAVKTLK
ncbi:MAG TPA: efflux RND transporter periplasmic adaptor subunit [Bdellovibrionales bacterium]|nr:efflux RND transporter periplasmic adaptor subunit [Bdellovibrionales bacterium]